MKKVLIITYYWPPSGGAGVQRTLKFVKYLPVFGIEPIVITVDANQATYPILDESLLKEVSPSIRVIRTRSFEPLKILSAIKGRESVPHGGFASGNKESITQKTLRFVRGNFFIPDARKGWVRFAVKAASEIIEKEKIDTVFISSPPHSSQLVGLELKEKYNIKWIADMRDPWTDIYYYKDLLSTKFSAARDAVYERKVLEKADVVISVSDPINRMFLSKSEKLNSEKFHVIPNGYDEDDFTKAQTISGQKFIITYVGTIADSYNPSVIFKAIYKLIEQFPKLDIEIRMVGSSANVIRSVIDENNLTKYSNFISHVDHERAIGYMEEASLLLLMIPDIDGAEGILTGKLFEYIGSGRPILGIGPVNGEAARIMKETNSGEMFDRNNYDGIYEFINKVFVRHTNHSEQSILTEKRKKYSRKNQAGELAKILLDN